MLTGRDTLALAGSLGAAGRAGIIETRGDTLWFRHELIHDALYQDWPLPLPSELAPAGTTIRDVIHTDLSVALAWAGGRQ